MTRLMAAAVAIGGGGAAVGARWDGPGRFRLGALGQRGPL